MSLPTDAELLAEYAIRQSDSAFATLVERHLALVHSAALRQTGDAHLASEIAQAVFIILARKAGSLGAKTILPGWLCRTAHFAARDALKMEHRRRNREHFAAMNQETAHDPPHREEAAAWQQIAPLLDEAVAGLREADRSALVLRIYEQRSLEEVDWALGIGADAAQKRVARALKKLRCHFARRGVTLTAALIAAAVAANSIQAAPMALAKIISAGAVAKGAAMAVSIANLVQGTFKALAWAKYKALILYSAAALVTATAVIVALPKTPAGSPVQIASRTNTVAIVREEPLTATASLWLETPPGAVVVQADGKIVIGSSLFGSFIDSQSGHLGQFTRLAIRLNADGSLDRSFYCPAGLSSSDAGQAHLDLQTNGTILVAGMFDNVEGQPRPGYASLHSDGSLNESFVPWFTNSPVMPTPLPDGFKKIYNYLGDGYGGGIFGAIYPAAVLSNGFTAVVPVKTLPETENVNEINVFVHNSYGTPAPLNRFR